MGLLSRLRRRAGGLAWVALAVALTGAASEAELKSAFVYRIARFVSWPKDAAMPETLRVAVLGEDPFAGTLTEMIEGEVLHGRRIAVRRVASPAEAPPCDVLVVSGEPASLEEIHAALGEAPVLTVGDAPGFARRGGMVGLVRDGPRIGLEINREAVDARGLRMSGQLLGLATIVATEGS